jgi:threonine dehydrogenase-like Zn-dependent dehydrogenase
LLAAGIGVKYGFDVHVLDRVTAGPKVDLVKTIGATYHAGRVTELDFEPDVIVECTGVGQVIADSIQKVGSGGILALTGVGKGGTAMGAAIADVAAAAVLKNNVIFGSVNANKRHWYKAATALATANREWLECLITRRETPENFQHALARKPDDIKVVIQFSDI